MFGELATAEEQDIPLGLPDAIPEVEIPEEAEQRPEPQTDYEKTARDRGWKPKEEYKGDPNNWAPADEYVRLTEDNVVFQRRAIGEMQKQIDATHKGMQQFIELNEREKRQAAEEGYKRALADMDARIRAAAEQGDIETLDKTLKMRDQVIGEQAKINIPPVQTIDPQFAVEKDNWEKENTWFNNNPILRDFAIRESQSLASQGITKSEQLRRVTSAVKETFPHLFQNPNRNNAPVMTATQQPNAPIRRESTKPSYDRLNAEAKRNCDEWVRAAKYSFNGQSEDNLRARFVASQPQESFKS